MTNIVRNLCQNHNVKVKQGLALVFCLTIVSRLFLTNHRYSTGPDLTIDVDRAFIEEDRKTPEILIKNDTTAIKESPNSNFEERRLPKAPQATQLSTKVNFIVPKKQTDEWMRNQERIYEQRKERIRQVCQKYKFQVEPVVTPKEACALPGYPYVDEDPPIERPNRRNMYLLRSSSVMACNQPKVGSSSIVLAFNLAGANLTHSDKYVLGRASESLRPLSEEEFREANQTYFKFMFVRHPMDRLFSAYINVVKSRPFKLNDDYFATAKQKAQSIMALRSELNHPNKRRSKRQIRDKNSAKPSLASLGKVFSHWEKTKVNIKSNSLNNKRQRSQDPTFEEFLEFILSTDLLGFTIVEGHWMPFWRRCSPCHIPYGMIGKIETTKDDFTYLWQRTGLDEHVPIPWLNKKASSSSIQDPGSYYATLPRDLIVRVYKRYHLDFEMFDYSINDILSQVGYEPFDERDSA